MDNMKYSIWFLTLICFCCKVDHSKLDKKNVHLDNEINIGSYLPDVNGDGIQDTINYQVHEDGRHFTLIIDNTQYEGTGHGLYSEYEIVDINEDDAFKEIAITLTDNKEWCLVEGENGPMGWFRIKNGKINDTNIYASEFFEGLSMAD
jgi:hypothetical protein